MIDSSRTLLPFYHHLSAIMGLTERVPQGADDGITLLLYSIVSSLWPTTEKVEISKTVSEDNNGLVCSRDGLQDGGEAPDRRGSGHRQEVAINNGDLDSSAPLRHTVKRKSYLKPKFQFHFN